MQTPTEPPATPIPLPALPIEAYYDSTNRAYMLADEDGNWMCVDKESLKLRLNALGYGNKKAADSPVSPVNRIILRIQNERNVTYVGPLAGFRRGLYTIKGSKALITHSPRLIESGEGEWPLLKQVIEQQLKSDALDQTPYYHGWLKNADECLRSGVLMYGQVLTLAGPRGCGKSLLQNLITEILGGRSAKPYRYMAGKTNFNRDLFGAEHQMIEDEQPFRDTRSRISFASAIKIVAATYDHSCHGKNREAITLTPFWRLSISVGDEPDCMQLLPLFDDNIMDKFVMLRCAKQPMPMPTGTAAQKQAFWKALTGELPAYMNWLRNDFVVPAEIREERYGIKPYFHPGLMSMLDELAPEFRLLTLIDQTLFLDSDPEWEGTAEELSRQLCEGPFKSEVRRLVNENSCGILLGKLAKSRHDRVSESRKAHARDWRILRPSDATEAPEPPPASVQTEMTL